jgi:hypothetical protein
VTAKSSSWYDVRSLERRFIVFPRNNRDVMSFLERIGGLSPAGASYGEAREVAIRSASSGDYSLGALLLADDPSRVVEVADLSVDGIVGGLGPP